MLSTAGLERRWSASYAASSNFFSAKALLPSALRASAIREECFLICDFLYRGVRPLNKT